MIVPNVSEAAVMDLLQSASAKETCPGTCGLKPLKEFS